MSENRFPPIPVAAYGVVLLAASLAYSVLQATLLRTEGDRSVLAAAIGTVDQAARSPPGQAGGHPARAAGPDPVWPPRDRMTPCAAVQAVGGLAIAQQGP